MLSIFIALLMLFTQYWVRRHFIKTCVYHFNSPFIGDLTGGQAAIIMSDSLAIAPTITQGNGFLNDWYDATTNTIYLSNTVLHGRSIAAVAIATHEVGHAKQCFGFKHNIIPQIPLIFICLIGFIIYFIPIKFSGLICVLYTAFSLFQFIWLCIEYDASRRAKKWWRKAQRCTATDYKTICLVLNGALFTYTTSLLFCIFHLINIISIWQFGEYFLIALP